jgi:hypothetical protein
MLDGIANTIYIDIQKNNFAALSVRNGRKRPIPSLLPCEMNFLKAYKCSEIRTEKIEKGWRFNPL